MSRIPLSVISGYLGAGKTTLINRLLAEDHGLKLLVMVNDFGAINIDEALIAQTGEDSIALTNGCICCSMGADLYLALGDILQRDQRPDHIVIEASGVADPAAIANAAKAEPQLSYAGIITLIDGLNAANVLTDALVAPQIAQQIRVADLTLLTKTQELATGLSEQLGELGFEHPMALPESGPLAPLLFGVTPLPGNTPAAPHPGYTHWHRRDLPVMTRDQLMAKMQVRPEGLYRIKGFVPAPDGMLELHVVGSYVETRASQTTEPGLVALGLQHRIKPEQIEQWWKG
ncbi:CobW family GTP-binding protein [Ruegeria sp.]|uniref:CobW family GTP-binding protein n=1 Tax=Ruegeria sp. TaxID=1879320 RepID=UPI003B5CDDDB